MRNSKLIKLICLILSIFMAVSLLGACSDKEGANSSEPSVSSDESTSNDDGNTDDGDDTADNNQDDFDQPTDDEDNSGDYWEEEEPPVEEEEDEGTGYEKTVHVFNGEAPIINSYRGMSSTVYHAYGHMLDDKTGRAYTPEMLELELSRLQNAGVHYARTRFTTEWAWDVKTGGWNWDSKRMNYYWEYCRNLAKRNIEVLQQVGWHLGVVMNGNKSQPTSISEHAYIQSAKNYNDKYGESAGYDFSQCPDADYRYYAKSSLRLAEAHAQLLLEAKKRGINNITHLLYFVEPSYADANSPGMEKFWGQAPDEYIFIVQTIQNKLKERGVYDYVKHVGPNFSLKASNSAVGGMVRYIIEKRKITDLFDVWTSHFYPQSADASDDTYYDIINPQCRNYIEPLKKYGLFGKNEFWIDEFYCRSANAALGVDSAWAGLQMAVGGIIAQQHGISNISTWQIFDQLWTDQSNTGNEFVNGIHNCGSAPSLFISSIPRSQYYTTQLFVKYHGYKNGKAFRTNNEELQSVGDPIHIGAAQLEDGNWTITVVNNSLDDYEVTVEFDKAIYQTLYRHLSQVAKIVCTTAAHLQDADKTFADVKDKFIDVVPAGSVAIYTGVKG